MIALDLCQANHQILLITYLKFTKKNSKDVRKEKKQMSMQFYWTCMYPYEFMDSWERYDETSLKHKKNFLQ